MGTFPLTNKNGITTVLVFVISWNGLEPQFQVHKSNPILLYLTSTVSYIEDQTTLSTFCNLENFGRFSNNSED